MPFAEQFIYVVIGAFLSPILQFILRRLVILVIGDQYRDWQDTREWCYDMHHLAEQMDRIDRKQIQGAAMDGQSAIPTYINEYKSKMDWVPDKIKAEINNRTIGDEIDEEIIECLYIQGRELRDHIEHIDQTQEVDYLSLLGPNDSVIGSSLMVRHLIEEEILLFRPKKSDKLDSTSKEIAKKTYEDFREKHQTSPHTKETAERIRELYLGHSSMPEFPSPE